MSDELKRICTKAVKQGLDSLTPREYLIISTNVRPTEDENDFWSVTFDAVKRVVAENNIYLATSQPVTVGRVIRRLDGTKWGQEIMEGIGKGFVRHE